MGNNPVYKVGIKVRRWRAQRGHQVMVDCDVDESVVARGYNPLELLTPDGEFKLAQHVADQLLSSTEEFTAPFVQQDVFLWLEHRDEKFQSILMVGWFEFPQQRATPPIMLAQVVHHLARLRETAL